LSAMLLGQVKSALTATAINRLAAVIVSPSLRAIKDRLDPDAYGGAPLLGVNGVCIIGHGSAGPRAIANGIAVGARAVRGRLTGAIAEGLSR
ncbi:MAG: phosphate--acyl-ACP acyltransferase, partial [Actinomycetota bacterium]|nr:phosphate--acyl-ACP acyltransferase [Actinomycetota bacterium]